MLPSLPGTASPAEPAEVGWDPGRIAQAWAELMRRLGYTRYVAQGGDVGASVTDAMGRQAPEGLAGIHMNLLVTALGGGAMPADTEQERAALEQTKTFRASSFGYFLEQGHAAADDRLRPAGSPAPWRPGARPRHRRLERSPAPSSTGSRPGVSPGTNPR